MTSLAWSGVDFGSIYVKLELLKQMHYELYALDEPDELYELLDELMNEVQDKVALMSKAIALF